MNGRMGRSWLAILLIVWAGSVVAVPARSIVLASSRLLSSCLKLAVPARTPTGRLRNTKHSTMIRPVPVSSKGGTLKARM